MKEWEGLIEKEFTIVIYADIDMVDDKRNYKFNLNSSGKDSAKTPPIFFPDKDKIDNNSKIVLDEIRSVLSNNLTNK